jgi:DNA end-binding protein Ku
MASTVWRGYITFGLISIPVRLYRAARAERVSLRRLYRSEAPAQPLPVRAGSRAAAELAPPEPELAPIRQTAVHKQTGEVLPEQSVVKGYEYEKNRFVAIEPEELKSIAPQTSAAMEIEEFVKLSDIDPVYFETSYYIHPEEAGEKAYGLLYQAMSSTGLAAIAQFAMHTREHVVVLRPGRKGILGHTMFYESEVRADEEYRADTAAISEKELKLAETLIHSLAGPFDPARYRDTYRERLEAVLARKVQGQPIEMPQRAPKAAEVVDIAEALRKSLANLKKPAASERPPSEKRSGSPAKRASRGAGAK